MENWKLLLKKELKNRNESFDNIIGSTLTEKELTEEFDSGFGSSEGKPFTAWTSKYVYFPAVYDGKEWVASVPRNVCDEKTEHIGGE